MKVLRTDKELHDISVALEYQSASAIAEQNLTSEEKDVTSIISQVLIETEAHGFSVSRQLAFVQFLSSIKDLNLSLFPELILKGMLNLIVTIARMHCSSQMVGYSPENLV